MYKHEVLVEISYVVIHGHLVTSCCLYPAMCTNPGFNCYGGCYSIVCNITKWYYVQCICYICYGEL